jgi:hypothetical protein
VTKPVPAELICPVFCTLVSAVAMTCPTPL